MSYVVDFNDVSTVGLESSPVAAALAGLRAHEARYFKNKYDHVFTVEPASNAKTTIDWVHRILKEERDIEATLNDAVRRAAAATGATYIDFSTVSEGHDACQPLGVRWIEPVLTGTNPVIVHPNALGESQMAAQTATVLGLH